MWTKTIWTAVYYLYRILTIILKEYVNETVIDLLVYYYYRLLIEYIPLKQFKNIIIGT